MIHTSIFLPFLFAGRREREREVLKLSKIAEREERERKKRNGEPVAGGQPIRRRSNRAFSSGRLEEEGSNVSPILFPMLSFTFGALVSYLIYMYLFALWLFFWRFLYIWKFNLDFVYICNELYENGGYQVNLVIFWF